MKKYLFQMSVAIVVAIAATLFTNWVIGGGFKLSYKDRVLIQWGPQ